VRDREPTLVVREDVIDLTVSSAVKVRSVSRARGDDVEATG
jgi:hypothetical protein